MLPDSDTDHKLGVLLPHAIYGVCDQIVRYSLKLQGMGTEPSRFSVDTRVTNPCRRGK